MTDQHQPRPEFVSQLEWQIQTAIQRRDRFAEPVRGGNWTTMRIALIVLGSVFMGAAGAVATEGVQESRLRELLLAQIETHIGLAALDLEIAGSKLSEVRRQHQAGLIGEEVLLGAEVGYREAETRIQALHLDQEEIRSTGQEPKNELSAPLVGGRDLVAERIRLRLLVAQEHASLASHQLARIQDLAGVGAVHADQLADATFALEEAQHHVVALQTRLVLRQRFLDTELSPGEVEREYRLSEVSGQLRLQTLHYERARTRVDRLRELVEAGAVPESQLRLAQLQLQQRELEIELVQQRLQQLMAESKLKRGIPVRR